MEVGARVEEIEIYGGGDGGKGTLQGPGAEKTGADGQRRHLEVTSAAFRGGKKDDETKNMYT